MIDLPKSWQEIYAKNAWDLYDDDDDEDEIMIDDNDEYGMRFINANKDSEVNVKCAEHMTCDEVIEVFVGFLVASRYHPDQVKRCLAEVANEYNDDNDATSIFIPDLKEKFTVNRTTGTHQGHYPGDSYDTD